MHRVCKNSFRKRFNISTAHFFKVPHLLSSDNIIFANQVKDLRFFLLDLVEYKRSLKSPGLIYNSNHKLKHITLMIQCALEAETYTEIELLLFYFTC